MSDNIPVLTKGYFVIFLIIFRQTTGITFPISEFLHFLVYYYRTAHYWKFTLFLCTVNYLQKQISNQLYIIRFDEDIAKKLGAPIFFFFLNIVYNRFLPISLLFDFTFSELIDLANGQLNFRSMILPKARFFRRR